MYRIRLSFIFQYYDDYKNLKTEAKKVVYQFTSPKPNLLVSNCKKIVSIQVISPAKIKI